MTSSRYYDISPEFIRFPRTDSNLLRGDFIKDWVGCSNGLSNGTERVWKKIAPGTGAILVGKIRMTYSDDSYIDHSVVIMDGVTWLVPYVDPRGLLNSQRRTSGKVLPNL